MNDKLLAYRAALLRRTRHHARWMWGGAAVLVITVCAFLVGREARARASAYEEHADALERSLAAYAGWEKAYQRPMAAESTAWLESEQAVRDLGVTLSTRIALAELVAQRVEDIGIADPRVRALQSDTISFAPVEAGGWQLELSPLALGVEVTSDVAGLAELMRALPPHVDVRSLGFARVIGVPQASLLLVTYRIVPPADAG